MQLSPFYCVESEHLVPVIFENIKTIMAFSSIFLNVLQSVQGHWGSGLEPIPAVITVHSSLFNAPSAAVILQQRAASGGLMRLLKH